MYPSTRIIPFLLIRNGGLYKTTRFTDPVYVGDPINAVRIFNDKECDEIGVFDIGATLDGRGPDLDIVANLASEAFMPMCYGGGVRDLEDLSRLFALGVEKVSLNTAAVERPELIEQAAARFGSQSIIVSIDVGHRRRRGNAVCIRGGREQTGLNPIDHAKRVQELGAGEVVLTSIDREGTGRGYDLDLIRSVTEAVPIPVIAHGGAGDLTHFAAAVAAGAHGVAAGSMFVFHGKHRAVLITYPSAEERAVVVP